MDKLKVFRADNCGACEVYLKDEADTRIRELEEKLAEAKQYVRRIRRYAVQTNNPDMIDDADLTLKELNADPAPRSDAPPADRALQQLLDETADEDTPEPDTWPDRAWDAVDMMARGMHRVEYGEREKIAECLLELLDRIKALEKRAAQDAAILDELAGDMNELRRTAREKRDG